ncbi:hypothetical protein [Salinigranum marinum]|uniref:hypothetical protein n=1 Tax=Salinigranum marinum TaxID=1515595 RepID=UPI00298A0191|nr:hypothetical protein [Salinigranum marinum]
MARDPLVAVQRAALERALVDDVDARRYFALAGALDAAPADETIEGDRDETVPAVGRGSGVSGTDTEVESTEVLPVALLSLAVAPALDDGRTTRSTRANPWTPAPDASRPAVRRGARLALRWFDVSAKRIAARAGLPTVVLTSSDE